MGGHLTAAGAWVCCPTHALEKDVLRRNAQSEHQSLVAVVGIEPVAPSSQEERSGSLHRFVSSGADLEVVRPLALKADLGLVDQPRQDEEPVDAAKGARIETNSAQGLGGARHGCHSIPYASRTCRGSAQRTFTRSNHRPSRAPSNAGGYGVLGRPLSTPRMHAGGTAAQLLALHWRISRPPAPAPRAPC
jgi:hypothetical protein